VFFSEHSVLLLLYEFMGSTKWKCDTTYYFVLTVASVPLL